jgi:hypothetical protein
VRRHLLVFIAGITAIGRIAIADAPTAYRCGSGKPVPGFGCECTADQTAARDADDAAICKPRPRGERQPKPKTTTVPAPVVVDVIPPLDARDGYDKPTRIALLQALETVVTKTQKTDPEYPWSLHRLAKDYYGLEVVEKRAVATATDETERKRATDMAAGAHKRVLQVLELAAEYDTYSRWDEVVYARAYELATDPDAHELEAKTWFELVKKRPHSPYTVWAYMRFGERMSDAAKADASQWGTAVLAYDNVLATKTLAATPRGYALYRRGIAHWNRGHFKAAVDDFKAARAATKDHATPTDAAIDAAAARALDGFE